MVPWVLAYYATVPVAARKIGNLMAPEVDRVVSPEHVVIHSHRIGREFLAQASLIVARRRRLPFVLSPYHHPKWHGYRYSGWTDVYKAADAVLTLTTAELIELARIGVRRDRLHVVGAAVQPHADGDGRRFRKLIGDRGRPIVLFVGQMFRYKGVAELVAAADALHAREIDFDLVFVGPHTRFSRGLFATTNRPWLHVLGKVEAAVKWDAIDSASIVCVPSQQESFGLVYLEAWASRKPAVGGRIPAVIEVVTEGLNGLLVDPTSVAELSHALERLLGDQGLAAQLGAAGAIELERRFNWRKVASRVEAVYDLVAFKKDGGTS
jgi:glycosyltransferase involved in cell wall biosynthesis